ncbi:MAG TPA: hypothetical protein VIC83_02060 [Candidatus Limnocylindria bacterium]
MTPPQPADRAVDAEEPIRFAWLARLLGRGLAAYVWLVGRTARVSGGPINQGQVIFAIWHETNLVGAIVAWKLRNDRRAVSFSTRGFRGIVMNTMLRSFGAQVVTLPDEGKGTRAEAAAMARQLAALGRSGHTLVVSCDGPFGPYRVAKPGVVIVARESGLPIQPWAVASRPPFRLSRRWDRMIVPLPFGRLRVFEGAVLEIGERDRIKLRLADLQARLDELQARADRGAVA